MENVHIHIHQHAPKPQFVQAVTELRRCERESAPIAPAGYVLAAIHQDDIRQVQEFVDLLRQSKVNPDQVTPDGDQVCIMVHKADARLLSEYADFATMKRRQRS